MRPRHASRTRFRLRLAPNQPAAKVLIVDDVPTNRDLLDELLSAIGLPDADGVERRGSDRGARRMASRPGAHGPAHARHRRTRSRPAAAGRRLDGRDHRGHRQRPGRHGNRGARTPAWMRSCGSRTGRPICSPRSASGWAFATSTARPITARTARTRSPAATPSALLAATERPAARPSSINCGTRRSRAAPSGSNRSPTRRGIYSEAAAAEIRALAADFRYDALVAALERDLARDAGLGSGNTR